jgi:hypothetical protein
MLKFAAGGVMLLCIARIAWIWANNRIYLGRADHVAFLGVIMAALTGAGLLGSLGTTDVIIDARLKADALVSPPIAAPQEVIYTPLEACQANFNTVQTENDSLRGQMDVLQNQVNACGVRLAELATDFNTMRTNYFDLADQCTPYLSHSTDEGEIP